MAKRRKSRTGHFIGASGAALTAKDIPGRVWVRIWARTDYTAEGLKYWLGSCNNAGYPQICWRENGKQYNVLLHHLFAKLDLNEGKPINTRKYRVHHLEPARGKRCYDSRNLIILTYQEHADLHAKMRLDAATLLGPAVH